MATHGRDVADSIEELEDRLAKKKAYLQFLNQNPLFKEFLELKVQAGE